MTPHRFQSGLQNILRKRPRPTVHMLHRTLGWCRSETKLPVYGVGSTLSQHFVRIMHYKSDRWAPFRTIVWCCTIVWSRIRTAALALSELHWLPIQSFYSLGSHVTLSSKRNPMVHKGSQSSPVGPTTGRRTIQIPSARAPASASCPSAG